MSVFAILLGLGASLGLWQVARAAPEREVGRWVDAGLGVLAAMLLGARAAYVVTHPEYYSAHPGEWMQLWQGGFNAWGAVPAALLGLGIAALALGMPLTVTLDRLAPLFAPLAVLGWLGCTAAGCAYGPALAPGAFPGLPALDEWGVVQPRFPLQAAAALALLGYNWGITLVLPLQAAPGRRGALTGLGLAAVLLVVALLGAEPAPRWNGLMVEAWAALGLGGLSLVLAVVAFWPGRKLKSF